MFSKLTVRPTLPSADMNRAKKFYSEKLGLTPSGETPDGGVIYKCNGSDFSLYPSRYAGTAKNTAVGFETDNLERDVKELRNRGVKFEEYDMPNLKTVDGIAHFGEDKAAWFKDREGNIVGLTEARRQKR